jgi:hypothetical protein
MSNEGVQDAAFFRIKRTTKERHGLLWSKTSTTVTEDQCNFKWLPWVPGKINYCSSQGSDVLSGFFSACWMARYVEGDARVCHIACQKDDHDCKQAWRNKKLTGITDVKEFDPHNAIKGEKILGLITSTGDFYAIGLNSISKLNISNPWKTPEKWKQEIPILNDIQAREFAAKDEVPFGNIYKGVAYLVVDIKGPITPQTFP